MSRQDSVAIVGTHQARLRCLLKQLYSGNGNNEVERFRNGAVVKMIITPGGLVTSLLYEGKANQGEETKNVIYDYETFLERFPPTPLQESLLNFSLIPRVRNSERMIIYLVRHGQALHNTFAAGSWQKRRQSFAGERDTNLTEEGKRQAAEAGIRIKEDIEETLEYPLNKVKLFSSDLIRTVETVLQIASQGGTFFDTNFNATSIFEKIIRILPCNHEIKDATAAACDGILIQSFVARENTQVCTPSMSSRKCRVLQHQVNLQNMKLSWADYCSFYGGKTRSGYSCGGIGTGRARNRCRSTTLLAEVVRILQAQGGGGRTARRTRGKQHRPRSVKNRRKLKPRKTNRYRRKK